MQVDQTIATWMSTTVRQKSTQGTERTLRFKSVTPEQNTLKNDCIASVPCFFSGNQASSVCCAGLCPRDSVLLCNTGSNRVLKPTTTSAGSCGISSLLNGSADIGTVATCSNQCRSFIILFLSYFAYVSQRQRKSNEAPYDSKFTCPHISKHSGRG